MSDVQNTILNLLNGNATADAGQSPLEAVIQKALPNSGQGLEQSLETMARQLDQLRTATEAQTGAIGENTQAVAANTQTQGGGGAGAVIGEVAKTAGSLLGGGLTFMPLLSGLASLFKGDNSAALPSLVPYVAPQAVNMNGTLSPAANQPMTQVDYGQDGFPRAVQQGGAMYAPQVTVQVQALDSKSFLDHSSEIASAVREAMLSAHSLNDVFNEM